MLTRATLESLLRDRQLDRIVAGFPGGAVRGESACDGVATGHACADQALDGGWPRGHLSALSGPPSAGRTTLLVGALAAATGGGELAALIDATDRFDPVPAEARGVVLDRVLWIRGTGGSTGSAGSAESIGSSRGPGVARALTQALRAFDLVLRAGGFALVALDLGGVPARAIAGLPPATWLRLGRSVEGSRTAALVLADEPVRRSAGGVSLVLERAPARWRGGPAESRLFEAPAIAPRVRGFRTAGRATSQGPGVAR